MSQATRETEGPSKLRVLARMVLGLFVITVVCGWLVFRTVRAEVEKRAERNHPPPMSQPATQPFDGTVQLCWGGTFSVIGLNDNAVPGRWWKIDGTPLDNPPVASRAVTRPMGDSILAKLDRQLVDMVAFEYGKVEQGANPDIRIEGVSSGIGSAEPGPNSAAAWAGKKNHPLPNPRIIDQLDRHAFPKPTGAVASIHGELEDREYQTFAIVKPNQTQAGPLKVEWKVDGAATRVTFSGDWQFPQEVDLINTNGYRVLIDSSSAWNLASGHSLTATSKCKLADIREVHFRMCGIQRFTITDVALDPGTRTSPKISIEHLHPTLNGQGPVWTGELPELQEFAEMRTKHQREERGER